ncbi:MAG: ATP-binding protein [Coxiellaceae bacterium]|nr:ATP-binding protein [Coxiellaceae bacterium]
MSEHLLFAITKKFNASLPDTESDSDFFKQSASNSVFNETNTTAADLIGACSEKLPVDLKSTAAYQTLERSLIEFANNAEQAHATNITVACYLNEAENQIRFVVHDNGDGLKPEYITTRYDWEAALQKRSTQASPDETTVKKSSGQHLGVSTAAYLVERNGGNLALSNNKEKKGARITVTSSLEPCNPVLFDQVSEKESLKINELSPTNIVEEMLHCIIKKQTKESDQFDTLRNILTNSASKTLKDAASAVKQRLGASPVSNSSIHSAFSQSPIMSPPANARRRPSGLTNLKLFSLPPALDANAPQKATKNEEHSKRPRKA